MRSARYSDLKDRFRESFKRRGAALLLALAVEALLVLVFLALAPRLPGDERPGSSLVAFDVRGSAADAPATAAPVEESATASAGEVAQPPAPVEPRIEPEVVQPPPEVALPPEVIWLSRQNFAASDLAKARSAPAEAPAQGTRTLASQGRGRAGDSEIAEGQGPNGEPLYAAEWHVRPTQVQLATYMPDRARRPGWGLIACRTVDNYRVEDCRELADSPRGSGLAGAVRQAAWQFRVRPPRVGGREMVGAWVSIRIDYTVS